MRERRWILLALYGFVLANAVSGALKATRPKFKIATTTTTSTTTEEPAADENENHDGEATTLPPEGNTTKHTLTGIPQIDYIWDPNLPRELNGYNLSDYPFYNSIPEEIDFKCDGLHDGFYASVPHKCQVYHHCLYGTRYDFLCANFTAFDQKTFICHFVSEVDCANSKKYWHRNDALYKATASSTTSTTSTTTLAPVTPARPVSSAPPLRERDPPRRRRPFRRRPAYEYYDDEYYDDEYSRPRGYDRRDDYEYEDRKYRRDRDRDFRDRERDFRDNTRPRDTPARDDRDRDSGMRDRFANRGNRRDPVPPRVRDPLEDESRPRVREPDQNSRPREVADPEDRRSSDKWYREDYDEKEPTAAGTSGPSNSEGYVKPAAPVASVYARPRAPPKIRRPVPLSEQDKYAYKTTSAPPVPPSAPAEDTRKRPAEIPEDDYYEDELEDVRPRRPMRRRPAYRERDRDFYDVRDRDRDRPYRPRYRDEEDDIRPRKHPERNRDRYYDRDRGMERGRDRSLDREKDRTPDRSSDRERAKSQDLDRPERPYSNRASTGDRDERPKSIPRMKDVSEITEQTRKPSFYERTTTEKLPTTSTTTTSTTTSTSTTCMPQEPIHHQRAEVKETDPEHLERPDYPERPSKPHSQNPIRVNEQEYRRDHPETGPRPQYDYQERNHDDRFGHHQSEDYATDYYDESEEPSPPPRPAVRIIKRPFLPSRGGNPNPRGLLPVGAKASTTPRREEERIVEKPASHQDQQNYYVREESEEEPRDSISSHKGRQEDSKPPYDAYKFIQSDLQHKQRPDDYDSTAPRPILRRPVDRNRENESIKNDDISVTRPSRPHSVDTLEREAPLHKWAGEEIAVDKQRNQEGDILRNKVRHPPTESSNSYTANHKNEDEQPTGPGNYRAKQRINEVTHRLQDIPESEYDVTLNDALTPTLNQETNLPSGFVLPIHRQINRDAVLQPSENSYKISRPVGQQQQQQQHQQQQQQQLQQQHQPSISQTQSQHKPFVPSPQFLPANLGANERARVYFRTPETIQISGTQYRQQRGPWHDYSY